MWGSWRQDLLLGLAAGLLLAWVALVAMLVIVRPRGGLLREAQRLLPDPLRLLPGWPPTVPTPLQPTIHAARAARCGERLGRSGAAHAERIICAHSWRSLKR
jgi:hypothetical protein